MADWLDFAFWVALQVAAVTTVFETTRRLTLKRLTSKGIYLLIGASLLSAAFGALYYSMHVTSSELATLSERNIYRPLPQDWCAKIPIDVCQKNSRAYVSAAFLGQGVLLKHVNATGEWITFQPTQQEISQREEHVSVNTQLREQAAAFARIAWTWWFSLVLALAFGYLVARQKSAANSTAEADARNSGARGSL